MLLFLATVLEQLDLALEHISKRDAHNARFGLLLTDNAIELILHQIAKDKANERRGFLYRQESYEHQAALEKALGRSFEHKVRFAKLEGKLSAEVAQTVSIMHAFRNEVYHAGLQHEAILPALSLFYFDVACTYIGSFTTKAYGWASNQVLPDRAKKYFRDELSPDRPWVPPSFFPGSPADFTKGCASLAKASSHDSADTISALADHMDEVISEQDECIGIVAEGIYENQRQTRDEAVIDCQAWALAFSDEGRLFARDNGWTGNLPELVKWLCKHYPLKLRRDPVPSWRRQAQKLRRQLNPHLALSHYCSFMNDTAKNREAFIEAANAVEMEIQAAIDRARGK